MIFKVRRYLWVYFLIFLYLVHIFYIIISQRFFYADGVHYFLKLLEEKTFIYADDSARHFAHYVTQFPLVIFINIFKNKSIETLSFVYGASLFMPQIISLILCFYVSKKRDIRIMVFPIISLFAITINMSFMIVHESNVILNIFWPLLFYILLVERYKLWDYFIVLTLGVIFLKCYEVAVFLGLILFIVTTIILFSKKNILPINTIIILIALMILFMISIYIAYQSIVHPRCPLNKEAILSGGILVFKSFSILLSILFIIIITILFLVPKFPNSIIYRFLYIALFIFCIFTSFMPILYPEITSPNLQYGARVCVLILLPLFSVLAVLIINGNIKVSNCSWEKVMDVIVVLVVSQLLWQIFMTSQWVGFKKIYKSELYKHTGIVKFEETILINENVGIQLIRPLTWEWNNPSLSLLWSNDKIVKSIILNPHTYKGWEPFDATNISELPDLSEYGIYKSYELFKKRNL